MRSKLHVMTSRSLHEDAVARISREFEKKGYSVQSRGNNLPTKSRRSGSIYRPDLLVRKNGQIVWIVEVETSEAGKAVVGAAALADVCMEIEKQKGQQVVNPYLLFVFYRTTANLELATKRLTALKSRISHLEDTLALNEDDAIRKISQLD